ncbi:MAG: PIG-L family deacetylase [Candidatus Woesearchaeota archaeon]|nr:PIG-L family deacetylase [Candidatus Woesearchaeota archaeon]
MKRVLVFCAHSDDQVFGPGGYTTKLAKEGSKIHTIICSYGEMSHPHLKEQEVQQIRVKEAEKADKMLGGSGVMFLGLKEGSFEHECKPIYHDVIKTIKKLKPDMILTHSSDDPHPDHRAVHRMFLKLYDDAGLQCSVYTFDVWNLFNLGKRKNPKLVVDVTKTFKKKIDALQAFKSQRMALVVLLWSVYTKAVIWGFRRGCRYAEVFYKIR